MHIGSARPQSSALISLIVAGCLVVAGGLLPGRAFAQPAAKLLLQTVCVTGNSQEYIAIYNPNDVAVDLSNYYITDGVHASSNTSYIYLVNRSAGTVSGGTFFDFNIRFPAGATIAARDTIAVAHQTATTFAGTYGRKPAFEVTYSGATAPANDPAVPDMRPAFPGAIPSIPDSATLSNGGESVVLYHWDGQSDLVTDIDYVFWGTNTGSYVVDKTGKSVDGPDAGSTATAYQADTAPGSQEPVASAGHTPGTAFRRENYTEGSQRTTGGNGVGGRDEMSENLGSTWSSSNPATPPFVKGAVQPAVLTARPGGPYSGTVGQSVSFNGSGSTPAQGGTITSYAWNFGDGQSGSGVTTTHTYAAAGSYTVTLTVTGSGGGTHAASTTATIQSGGGGGTGTAKKLLFQTVCVTGNSQEYLAIYNPNAEAVDLSNYYITDAIHIPDTYYLYIANPAAGLAGGGTFFDFHIRFPAGASIAAGDTIAIAHQTATTFNSTYGRKPAFEVAYTGASAPANDPTVPDMRPAFPGSVASIPDSATLSNGGESVAIYYWDGQSDLVTDIDYVFWGTNSGSYVLDKSGKSIDGPDSDSAPTAYRNDTAPGIQVPVLSAGHSPNNAFRREDFSEGTQFRTGGNGVDGRDETSEPLASTFSSDKPATPPFVKGAVQPAVLTARPGGPYSGTVGQSVSFNGSGSTPAQGGTITSYAWNFGDGQSGSGVTTTHTYAAAGSYTVTLTVTGSGGGTNAASTTATIQSGGGGGTGTAKKLLFQTVCVTGNSQEYLAIYNPNAEAVDLSNYYITDAIHIPETYYLYIVNPSAGVVGGGTFFDFHIRFPAGASIAAGDTIAIAHQTATTFNSTYGRKPAFEVAYTGASAPANDPAVPDMRPAFPGSVASIPDSATLSNGGESVALYYWDGQSDLVTDIDYVFWGTNSGSYVLDKSGKSIDGPDSDSAPTAYRNDTAPGSQVPVAATGHTPNNAFRREDFTEGAQRTTGGNGVDGRDETSEPLASTFSSDKAATPPFVKSGGPIPGTLTAVPGGPYVAGVNDVITFDGSRSSAPTGGSIANYAWTFGDGGSGTGARPTHAYTATGTYTVTLTVTSNTGGTNSASTTATISTVTPPPTSTGFLQVKARTFLPTLNEKFPITIDVPGGYLVTLRIYDIDGREIKVLYDGDALGLKTYNWDGRDDQLMLVEAGTYICHLEKRDRNGHFESYQAPVVVARRLERN